MRKFYSILIASFIVLIGLNVLFFSFIYKTHLVFQKNNLQSVLRLVISEVENTVNEFESDLNFVAYHNGFSNVITSNEVSNDMRKLELFYSSYNNLIENIIVYDNNKNVVNLYLDSKKHFITDQYQAQRQRLLYDKQEIIIDESHYQYFIPVLKGKEVIANIVVSIDFSDYIIKVLQHYNSQKKDQILNWLVNLDNDRVISSNLGEFSVVSGEEEILAILKEDHEGLKIHEISADSVKFKAITMFAPCNVMDNKYGIAVSSSLKDYLSKVYSRAVLLILAILVLFVFSSFFLVLNLRKKEQKLDFYKADWQEYNNLFENLPYGILVADIDNKISKINKAARDLLLIKEDDNLSLSDISNRFLKDSTGTGKQKAYDKDQFILYERQGNEVVIYKKDIDVAVNNKEYTISALMDITDVEKARKFEAASNSAKSEFLAKMSHEIRTPMNGIIGMTDALEKDDLSETQKEYVTIVKRSADLLMNIIDDILDYSKIEAGKMQIEEIPFNLSEEVKISLDLFAPIIEEKGLQLKIDIKNDVPERIIGDPFRLRQVISNLISNAVKFTHEGIIEVKVQLEEEYSGNITLHFSVSDTGVGIPKEKLESIFNSFTQAEQSTSRKYGGSGLGTTICKQLVTLMNGEIWVESPSGLSKGKNNPGTTFNFTIEAFSDEDLQKEIDVSNIKKLTDIQTLMIAVSPEKKTRLQGFLKHYNIPYKVQSITENISHDIKTELESKKYNWIIIVDEASFDGIWLANKLNELNLNNKHRLTILSNNHKPENYIVTKRDRVDHYIVQPFEHKHLKQFIKEDFPNINIDEKKAIELRKDIKILVAEDNLINQKVAESIFSALNYKIDIAYDGKKAVEMVKKKSYDVIFMDLQMPGADGIESTVELRGLGYQMPIVAMTATASNATRENALSSGMNDYVVKPVKAEAIRAILEKWFA